MPRTADMTDTNGDRPASIDDAAPPRSFKQTGSGGEKGPRSHTSAAPLQNRSRLIALIICCAILVASFAVLTFSYTQRLYALVDEESQQYLEEISSQMNTSLVRGMTSNYAVLKSYADKVEQIQNNPSDSILADLPNEAKTFGYQQMALIDSEGRWVTQNGAETVRDLLDYVAQMKGDGQPVTTPILSTFGEDCVVFLSPLENTVIDGTQYIGVAALANMDMLNNMLSTNLFDGAGYSHVVTSRGTIVIRSNQETNTFLGYNLLKYLEKATFYDGITVEQIQQDFEDGVSRKTHYVIDGQDLLSVYLPVGYDDWYLYTVIPSNTLNERTSQFYQLTLLVCALVSALFLALFVALFALQTRSQRKLKEQLYVDPVTGGRSKAKFEKDVEASLRALPHASMVYANINKFKLVNERDGSKQGDKLLAMVYRVISEDLAHDEMVSRLMADHFGVLLATQDIPTLQHRTSTWNERVREEAIRMNTGCSVSLQYGIAPVTDEHDGVTQLLDKANLTRKAAVAGSTFNLYDKTLAERLRFEQELEDRQEKALANDEFVVYFQPKFSPQNDRIMGAEALIRWITPDGTVLMPDQYIPLFEANGFIASIDLYVFEQTCRFIREIESEGLAALPVSVNLSRYNLNDPDFIYEYAKAWQESGLDDPSLIEFEITESLVFENMEHLDSLLHRIHQYGFRAAMDDFGSGYSSLNMLKNMDIDVVKLDREFFNQGAADSQRALLIVKRLIELTKDLGMTVVAEGVETRDVVDFLREQQCDMIQGYYYSRPIPEADMKERLKREGSS